jgi:hypothetical protein
MSDQFLYTILKVLVAVATVLFAYVLVVVIRDERIASGNRFFGRFRKEPEIIDYRGKYYTQPISIIDQQELMKRRWDGD